MDKETLEKANKIAKQIKEVENILKGVKEGGELQIASWVKIKNTFMNSSSQAGSVMIKPQDDFIGIGLMNLLKGYLEGLNKELAKL